MTVSEAERGRSDPRTPEAEAEPRFDIDELVSARRQRSFRKLPTLLRGSVKLVWRSAPRLFLASAALQAVGGAGVALQVLVARNVLRDVLPAGGRADFGSIVPALVALAVVTAVVAFANLARNEQQRLLSELVARAAMDQVLDVATRVDLLAFETPSFHNRLQRATVNASVRPLQMASGTLGVLSSLLAIGGIGIALVILEPLFVVLVLLAYVPAWYATTRASRVAHEYAVKQTERDRRRYYLVHVLTDKKEAKEVRSFGTAGFLRDRYNHVYDETIVDLRALVRRRLAYGLAGGLVTSALTAGTIAVLVWFVTSGRTPLAEAGAAAGAVVLLGQRLQGLAASVGAIFESSLFVEDFSSFVDLLPALDAARPSGEAPTAFERITVDDVWFTYPSATEPSLHGVSLEVAAGEVVALVGENGSGKTTLAKILAALYAPSTGSVQWDDTDVADVDPDKLRRSIAVIYQDFAQYHLSARENIGIGRHERFDDLDGIVASSVRAGAHGYLETLSRGYETQLGPEFFGGSDLSIGQWQRVALARAFFRDAPLLILDEPTASLDPKAEAALFEDMSRLAEGRSVVLISHRFSSVRSADRIYVLDAGRIIEHGTHGDLLAAGGTYAEMFTLQAAAYR